MYATETHHEYRKRIESAQNLTALKNDLFGESVSLFDGKTDFNATDIDLSGNNALPVSLRRRFNVEIHLSGGSSFNSNIEGAGGWDVDVPYITGMFAPVSGWGPQRCSVSMVPNVNGSFGLNEIWQGNTIHVPDGSDRTMLGARADTPHPDDGVTRKWSTAQRDAIDCIPMKSGLPGEGFRVTTTSGLRYYFDIAAQRNAGQISKPVSPQLKFTAGRTRVFLLASKMEDRFGNTVEYQYDGNGHPTRIWSSDGREITATYNGAHLASSTANGRTWTYEYATVEGQTRLSRVVRPDGSNWRYSYSNALSPSYVKWDGGSTPNCAGPPEVSADFTLTVEHPSGAIGAFEFSNARHYRSGIHMSQCVNRVAYSVWGSEDYYELTLPNFFDVMSLYRKTLSGPGIKQPLDWTYSYGGGYQALWGTGGTAAAYPCGNCETEKPVVVTNPDGTKTQYRYGFLYAANEGRLLGSSVIDKQGNVVSSTSTTYMTTAEVAGEPFAPLYGTIYNDDDPSTAQVRPVVSTVIQQDGTTFQSVTNAFDSLARPTSVTRSNPLHSRTDVTEYHDNLSRWLLDQTAKTTNIDTGLVESQTIYDDNAMPLRQYAFGKLTQSLAYYGAGHLKSVTDGRSNTTTLSSWKRGVPQLIQHPDSTTESAVVNDNGTIASTTDENGFATAYEYDPIGRLAKVTYPDADTVAWAPTTQVFEPVTVSEYGIPAGHWRQTVATGNYRKVSYFDAFWRPVLTREYDNANAAGTSRFTAAGYDHDGRTTFTSYPVASTASVAAITQGVRTQYDALGRPTRNEQDNELGSAPLVSTTDYLAGFKTRTTNPRGKQVTTSYLAFGEPTTDWPISIVKHADANTTINTDIARNTFGKPLSMTQRNDAGTITATRSYSYNAYQQLCRTSEPEGGTTVFAYDGAGNLVWSAPGVPATTTCTSSISATAKINRAYDQRNRITALTFPDNLGNTSYTYYPDGQPHTLATDNGAANVVTTTYVYNKRRLLTGENLQWPNVNWNLGYGYSANGHLASQTYPDKTSVTYLPNALGQPTQASAYATGVSYYPNGSIKQFTYGNGIVHDLTQNLRGLAERSRDAYGGVAVHDDNYDYDANGNVAAISDGLPGAPGNRTMTYDNFGRLTGVTAPMFGGDGVASFGYDVLDNLLSAKVGNKSHVTYTHDATRNVLSTVRNSAGTVTDTLGYDARGNVTSRTNATYTFDRGNRLRSVMPTSGAVSSYVYDGHGRRVRDIANGDSKYSQYNQAGQLMYDSDLRLDLRTSYIHLGGSLVATRRLDPVSGAVATRYQHTDALGSPVAVTDPTRTVIERNQHAPYGAQISGPVSDGPGYTGHVQDTATGLTYMQQRYYDPSLGRFLSVDPVAADTTTGWNFNRYNYAANNPYKFKDPDGRVIETVWDVANVVMDVASLGKNLATGNYAGAAVDAGGLIVDAVATVVPGVPGGAGTAIRVARGGDEVLRSVKASDRVSGVATGTGRAADREALRNAGVPTSQSRADVKGPGGSPVPKAERQQMTRDSSGNPVVVSRHQPHPGGNQPHDSSPHSHAATPKIEGAELQKHKDGTVRYHN